MREQPDPVDLWSVLVPACGPTLLEEYRRLLSSEELAREARFHFPEDRRRHVVSRALVRTVLARYASIAPEAWAFEAGAHGRPEIVNAEGRDLRFSLSHAGDLVILGVTRGGDVGVDTESLSRPAPLDVADRYFSPEEALDLRALPPEARAERFVQYWTLKESYLKALGLGLSIPLDAFTFRFPIPGRVEIAAGPAPGGRSRWWFWQLRSPEGYLVSVCSARTSDRAPALRARRVVPLVGERACALPVICASPESRGRRSVPESPHTLPMRRHSPVGPPSLAAGSACAPPGPLVARPLLVTAASRRDFLPASSRYQPRAATRRTQADAQGAHDVTDREQHSLKTIKNYMWWSMGAGLIPIPFVDLVAVSGVQLKMLADVSKTYGVEFHENRGKALVGSLIGYVVPSTMSFGSIGSVLKAVPLVGTLVGTPSMVAFCGASTWALGKVFVQHFESGGTFLDFDPLKVKEHFQRQFDEGQALTAKMKAEKKAEVA